MAWIILLLVVVLFVVAPGWWVRHVMRTYAEPADRYASTGGELARHLLDEAGLSDVTVEESGQGDHYDPLAKSVRLAPQRLQGRSLTAVTVAAHEVGHALQDASGYVPLRVRTRLVAMSRPLERIGALALMVSPLAAIATRAPYVTALFFFGGLLSLGTSTLVHLVTLPTEFNASFARALPLLKRDGMLFSTDHRHARRILMAAALTYVAASLAGLLNIGRWWALLRR